MLNQTSSFPKDIHSSLMAIVDIVFPVKATKKKIPITTDVVSLNLDQSEVYNIM
jgi:hypothetical protein